MNLSSKLLKYLEGMRVVELLHDDERAIFSLFGLSFDITADKVLEQQDEFKKKLLMGVILELLDYNVVRGQVPPVAGAAPVAGVAPGASPFPPAPDAATSPFPPTQEPAGEGSADDLPF